MELFLQRREERSLRSSVIRLSANVKAQVLDYHLGQTQLLLLEIGESHRLLRSIGFARLQFGTATCSSVAPVDHRGWRPSGVSFWISARHRGWGWGMRRTSQGQEQGISGSQTCHQAEIAPFFSELQGPLLDRLATGAAAAALWHNWAVTNPVAIRRAPSPLTDRPRGISEGLRRSRRCASTWLLLLSCFAACDDEPDIRQAREGAAAAASAPAVGASAPPREERATTAKAARSAVAEQEEPEEGTIDSPSPPPRFELDELVDVAPAGPAAASPWGVVLVTKHDVVHLAKLASLTARRNPGRPPVSELDVPDADLAPLARGPAVVEDQAYWVSNGRLVRAPLRGGALQVLAMDARSYTRVAAASEESATPPTVAYIARRPGAAEALHARLWTEGHGTRPLSPEGAGASSVALAGLGSSMLALVLEGRTGMTPLHARHLTFQKGKPQVGSDVVVWVGGSAQSLSEVHAIGGSDHAWAFLAMERDVTHFGLAKIRVDARPRLESEIAWRNYPNGLDPAPMATSALCGTPALFYVRPASEEPRSPQELALATLRSGRLSSPTILARGRAFSDVSAATVKGGVLVVYVADRRTWAVTLRC